MQRRRKRNTETLRIAMLLAIACLGLAGCSEQRMAQVAGRIVYAEDGAAAKDLVGHKVSFLCNQSETNGKEMRISATGEVAADGTFTMNTYVMGDGVLLGTHQIAITPPLLFTEEVLTRKPIIPPRFGDPARSGLTAKVDGDTEVMLEVRRAP